MTELRNVSSVPATSGDRAGTARASAERRLGGPRFADVLQNELTPSELSLSSHARERLVQRGIRLDAEGLSRLEEAFDLARRKGVNESLVLLDDLAFIVSVKDRRIVTAMEARAGGGKVFTNIDGAVLA